VSLQNPTLGERLRDPARRQWRVRRMASERPCTQNDECPNNEIRALVKNIMKQHESKISEGGDEQ